MAPPRPLRRIPLRAKIVCNAESMDWFTPTEHLGTRWRGSIRWLTVIPLADAVTLPDCSLPAGVVVVSAFHGGLLGDAAVLPMVSQFLTGHEVTDGDRNMREAAEMITGASAVWRMPDTRSSCL